MSTMYGADVAQLRALAGQFDRLAAQLDGDRMTVGNAIQISAWVGPVAVRFRHTWESDYSRRLHGASERLRSAARALGANADDQERASAAGGGAPGQSRAVHNPSSGRSGTWMAAVAGAVGVALAGKKVVKGLVDAARLAKGASFLVANYRGPLSAKALNVALQFSHGYKTLDGVSKVLGGASKLATGLAVIGVGVESFNLGTHLAKGEWKQAAWSGFKVALGVGALATPPPVNVLCAGVSGAIAVGEFAGKHSKEIRQFASATANAAVQGIRTTSKFFARLGRFRIGT